MKVNIHDLMPHGACWRWDPLLVFLHSISDVSIVIAYFLIPSLIYYIYRQGHLVNLRSSYPRLWTLGALFILLCGISHLGAIIEIWFGGLIYWITGIEKILTGIVSLLFAQRLWVLRDELIIIGRVMDELKKDDD